MKIKKYINEILTGTKKIDNITLNKVFYILDITQDEFNIWCNKNKQNFRLYKKLKNYIIYKLLEEGLEEPRKIPMIKFYLEALDSNFFIDKQNSSNEGEGNIKFDFYSKVELKEQ